MFRAFINLILAIYFLLSIKDNKNIINDLDYKYGSPQQPTPAPKPLKYSSESKPNHFARAPVASITASAS